MNIAKKAFCRVFQFGFRIALPVLPFRDPKILRRVEEVPDLLKRIDHKHPLLVTDKMIRSLGLTKPLENAMTAAGIPFSVYDETDQNPTSNMVSAALDIYKKDNCDCLIAVGGGSAMDCAKAVGCRVVRPNKTLEQMGGLMKVGRHIPTMIAVPTTAGTGSETTAAAIIVDSETRHKYAIDSFGVIPNYAVLDAHMIHSLPKSVAAATGIDALTHAVEAYIGGSTTRHTRADAVKAVRLIFESLESAANHTSFEAESSMMTASHLAGRAFTRSFVGYVHAVSHSLSGKYNMPHGLTNAILLPIVLEMYGAAAYKKLAKLAKVVRIGHDSDSDEVRAKAFIKAIRDLNDRLGIPRGIAGIKDEDIPEMARHADKEANPLYPVPVLWNAEELSLIYKKAGENA